MTLIEYIQKYGDKKSAKLFGATVRTVVSWRLGYRKPRYEQALVITQKSPVTWEGIYKPADR